MTLKSKPSVLFFLPNISGYSDRARVLLEASKGLDRLILLVGRNDADLDTTAYPRFQIVQVGFHRGWRFYNVWRACRIARQLIREHEIDVVHDTFATLLPLFRKKTEFPGVSFVESLYTLMSWRMRFEWGDTPLWKLLSSRSTAQMFPNIWLERSVCKVADAIVLQAPGLKDRLRSVVSIAPERIHVIPNSFDPDWWGADDRSVLSLNRDNSVIRLLSTGGIGRPHGIFPLLEALARLRELGVEAHVTVIGHWGPFVRKQVLKMIQVHGLTDFVSFPGRVPVERVRELFYTYDLCIYQCRIDGSPRSILEAVGSGIPVIASEHPGISVLDPEREFIAFTEFGDANRIVEFVEDYNINRSEWLARGELGKRRVASHFSIDAVAAKYIQFYQGLPCPGFKRTVAEESG